MTEIKNFTESYNIRGDTVKVTSKRKVDEDTGKLVFDENLDNIATTKALDIYRNNHDMIFPNQIKKLRESYGLSQRDFASLLSWSPTTIVAYEGGLLPSNGHNTTLKLLLNNKSLAIKLFKDTKNNLSYLGQKRFDTFIHDHDVKNGEANLTEFIDWKYKHINGTQYTGYSKFNLHKFANLVIYFVTNMAHVTETKLCKLLYFSDFLNYGLQTVSITGTPYVKLPHGPVPDEYDILYKLLIGNDLITPHIKSFGDVDGTCYTANRKFFNRKLFSKNELNVIDYVMKRFKHDNATKLSELSHKELGWKKNKVAHNISYKYGIESHFLKQYIDAH